MTREIRKSIGSPIRRKAAERTRPRSTPRADEAAPRRAREGLAGLGKDEVLRSPRPESSPPRGLQARTSDMAQTLFLKLNANDPIGSVKTHSELSKTVSDLRNQAKEVAQDRQTKQKEMEAEAQNHASAMGTFQIVTQAFTEALKGLSEPERQALLSHLGDGLGFDEIAGKLGLPNAEAAEKLFTKALAKFIELLKNELAKLTSD